MEQIARKPLLRSLLRAASTRPGVSVRALTARVSVPNWDLAAITAAAKEVNGTFCCGGELQPKSPIKITCYNEAAVGKSNALLLSMPVTQAYMPDLLSHCQEASFGRGSESVLDPSYRRALCLSPSSFSTSFSLEQHGILATVKTLMLPNSNGILTAELYKLNIYRPGDFFKSHVDTPRGSGMFGSLVVCLPQPHTGGQLKLHMPPAREPEQQAGQNFDWGAGGRSGAVQWAAFFSDCPHEILPVESGHRITLTYNLHLAPAAQHEPPLPGLSTNSMALHAALHAALANPSFMPFGGTLGFACQHTYPHTVEGLCDSVPAMLKGGDAALIAVAHALGLEAEVQAVHDTEQLDDYYDPGYDDTDNAEQGTEQRPAGEREDDDPSLRLGGLSPLKVFQGGDEYFSPRQAVQTFFRGSSGAGQVTWALAPSRWALQVANATYGNEHMVREWYSAAAILVKVPERSLRKQ